MVEARNDSVIYIYSTWEMKCRGDFKVSKEAKVVVGENDKRLWSLYRGSESSHILFIMTV